MVSRFRSACVNGFVMAVVLFGYAATLSAADSPPSPEQLEFFEKQVRPLLIEHCSECHGAKKSEAGLRLDTKRGFYQKALECCFF